MLVSSTLVNLKNRADVEYSVNCKPTLSDLHTKKMGGSRGKEGLLKFDSNLGCKRTHR